ncbi:MAG: hypothetical protein COZ07_08075 [Candidatus Infernicultor aquiphilus]|uniref:Uncharacterized protein n=1 Tax=Candidatus Infernicultor aquiphilus TaxID=1805029 RepID=A0A2M7PMD0_9BACT|nr:MAG: hypothetical protein COZ85_01595 [Candidatus Moranbacteria bacterium CG_4_8_14_3_um_filter_34_16]PIY31783.1 MAG: hypothetical protein COZ07_08075 [Candidatus Atribacteria bacterium CG_4_10_14_3_um_filter_34_13]
MNGILVGFGTNRKLNAVYSLVEGKYPNLGENIGVMTRFVGGKDKIAVNFLKQFFSEMNNILI